MAKWQIFPLVAIETDENNITGILLNVAFNTNNYNRIMWKINIKNYRMWYYKNNLTTDILMSLLIEYSSYIVLVSFYW
jgi:hypothetical protein